MAASPLSGQKILVTGGAGFLGGVVVGKLKARGAEVFVPRRKDYDLTDRIAVERVYADSNPDVVIHLAAEVGGIGANQKNPGRYAYANLIMGTHMIEVARLRGLKKFVQIGTICAYPKFTPVPFREEDLWNGYPEETNAPYGEAKKMLLVLLQAYRQQYGFNGIYLLPVNLFGPNDNFDLGSSHVIPAMIRKFLEARWSDAPEVVLWGTGGASREFIYADDCADAILLATESYESPDPVNLGSGREITIKDLAVLVAELTGYKGSLRWDASKPDGQPRRCLNTEKAENEFGFRSKTTLRDGLVETIRWYTQKAGKVSA